MNMYALLYIGVLLEPILGRSRFISAYLLTGLTASITSLWWHDLTISAGASGAIFGMYGVFLAMLTTNVIEEAKRKALLTSIAIFVGYNLIYGLKGGIDNAAHIGGLLGGLVIGYASILSLKKPECDHTSAESRDISIGRSPFMNTPFDAANFLASTNCVKAVHWTHFSNAISSLCNFAKEIKLLSS